MSGDVTGAAGAAGHDDGGALFDSAAVVGGEIVLRPWRPGDDLALLEVWGDPANAQQHQDRAMLAEDAERPWRRTSQRPVWRPTSRRTRASRTSGW